jgi:hypothetical protein
MLGFDFGLEEFRESRNLDQVRSPGKPDCKLDRPKTPPAFEHKPAIAAKPLSAFSALHDLDNALTPAHIRYAPGHSTSEMPHNRTVVRFERNTVDLDAMFWGVQLIGSSVNW